MANFCPSRQQSDNDASVGGKVVEHSSIFCMLGLARLFTTLRTDPSE